MSFKGPEPDISEDIADLKKAYHVPSLDVVVCHNQNIFEDTLVSLHKEDLGVDKQEVADSPFGMLFLPRHNSSDGEPHIIVQAGGYARRLLKSELTHEFSNNEASNRWGEEFQQYEQAASQIFDNIWEMYPKRVSSTLGLLDRLAMPDREENVKERVQAYFHSRSSYTVWDTPSSVPADFITVEKGFGDRLMDRKRGKLKDWISGGKNGVYYQSGFLFTYFPYLAYASFHPSSSRMEKVLDAQLERYLQRAGCQAFFHEPIREIKEALHDITIPLDCNKLIGALGKTAIVYLSLMSQATTEPHRTYWGILRDVARDSFTNQR